MNDSLPVYDDVGINLADPNDRRGHKTRYITTLQHKALERLLAQSTGNAVDVGCGYGRMSWVLQSLGYSRVIGIDPSSRVLSAARRLYPGIEFIEGGLPDLPIEAETAQAVFLLNVLRSLHLMNQLHLATGAVRPLAHGGRLIVLDNLRQEHPDYVPEATIISLFESVGLRLVSRNAIRGARWPWIFPIQLGWIPERWHMQIARFELWWMSIYKRKPRIQYHNVVWIFEKP